MAHVRSVLLPLTFGLSCVVAFAPGCSNNGPPTAQAAIDISLSPGANSAANCQVGGGVEWKIGDPAQVQTVSDGGKAGTVPVNVQCTVSGNDSAGYTVQAEAKYGDLGTFLVSGSFKGAVNGVVPTATGIHGDFTSGQPGFIASLAASDCTVTFTGNQGIAPTRIWGNIDCPDANDPNRSATCDGSGEFLFENCQQ